MLCVDNVLHFGRWINAEISHLQSYPTWLHELLSH